MATGQYPHRTPGAFTVNHKASQVIMVWPCLFHDVLPEIILEGTLDGSRRSGKLRKS